MDEACGLRKKEEVFTPAQLQQGTAEVASWNKKKVRMINIYCIFVTLSQTLLLGYWCRGRG